MAYHPIMNPMNQKTLSCSESLYLVFIWNIWVCLHEMGDKEVQGVVPGRSDVLATEYLAHVIGLLKLRLLDVDKVLAAMDSGRGQAANPIVDHYSLVIQADGILP